MDFEELQRSWQQQAIDIPDVKPEEVEHLMSKWDRQQRKLKRNNIIVTISFALVFADFGYVYYKFHSERPGFYGGSILMMALCMLVYLWVIWRGVAYDRYDASSASNVYIDKYLEKLYWQRKTITHFTWIYGATLWLAFMFYCYSLESKASMAFKIWAPLIITIYIAGMMLLVRLTKGKKKLKAIDELIKEMEDIKSKLE